MSIDSDNSGGQVFWPKHEDVHKTLKVECTPILGDIQYPTIFAISLPVAPGNFFFLDILIHPYKLNVINVYIALNFFNISWVTTFIFFACTCIQLAVVVLFIFIIFLKELGVQRF